MKNINRIITFALVCVLMLSAIPLGASAANDDTATLAASDQVFADVAPGTWYYEAVNAMAKGGLLAGYSDGLFHPNDYITYGQFAMVLCKITGTPTVSKTGENYLNTNHWAAYAMRNILQTCIFERGYNLADQYLWRGEALTSMATLTRHMSKYNYSYDTQVTDKVWTWDDIPDAAIVTNPLKYSDNIHRWAYPNVLCSYNLGITVGVDSAGTCNPTKKMTRAEICLMLYNMGISSANSVTVRGGTGIM